MTELRSFLGLANYYKKFIQGYSKKVAPLTDLLKNDKKWVWTDACQEAFEKLKVVVSSEPVLRLPDFELPFEVHTDASDKAIGGVLVQKKHHVAYESRKLNKVKQKCSAHEKEMIALVHCLLAWHVYLLGPKFVVRTDNVANTLFNTPKKLSLKQARCQELLQEYDFMWEHKLGKHNEVANALSHKQVQEYVAALTRMESNFMDRIKESAKLDATYQKLVQDVTAGLVRHYWLEDGLLHAKGGKPFVPSGKIRRELLKETHDPQWVGHPSKDRMYALLSRSYYWPKMELDIELYVKTCLVCQQDKGLTQKEAGLL